MTYYKAVRMDGTSFYDHKTVWEVGKVTEIEPRKRGRILCMSGILHASTAPGEVLVGATWPCRLLEVEPVGPIVARDWHKVGAHAWRVVRELPPEEIFGPQQYNVTLLWGRMFHLTRDLTRALALAYMAMEPSMDAMNAARMAVIRLHRQSVWEGLHGSITTQVRRAYGPPTKECYLTEALRATIWAAMAVLVRDGLPFATYLELTHPWRTVMEWI